MNTKTMEVYLHSDDRDEDAVFQYEDMTAHGYVLTGSATVTFKMRKHSEVVNDHVNLLSIAKTELQAKTNIQLAQLDAKIQNLLAITHDGGAA